MLLAITVNSQYSNMKNRLLRQQIEIWIETCSEQTANQNTNIAWQYCKVASKRTTGFTVNNYVGGFIQLSRVLLTSIGGGGGIWERESARGTWRGGYFPLLARQKLPLSTPLSKPTMQVSKAGTQDGRGNRKVRRPLYSHTCTCTYHFSTQTNSFRYLTAIFLSCKTQLKQYDS